MIRVVDSDQYGADLFPAPLTLAVAADVEYNSLRSGICYMTNADPGATGNFSNTFNITPWDPTASEAFIPGQVDITGSPNAEVSVSFVLPSRLYPTAGGTGHIDMAYDIRSATWGDANGEGMVADRFFNPQDGLVTPLTGSGTLTIWMGGNPCVSKDATDITGVGTDLFTNEALVTAEYTGN